MIQIYNTDGIDFLKSLRLDTVRVITDPPYGNHSYNTDKAVPFEYYKFIIESCLTSAFFGYPENLVSMCVYTKKEPIEWITWHPNNKAAGRSRKYLPKESEHVCIFGILCNPDKIFRDRPNDKTYHNIALSRGLSADKSRLGDVWGDPSPGMAFNHHLRNHPNEKPLSLMRKLVTLCSNKGDTVIDPFMGSGTTGVACVELDRNFIGCETDQTYFEIAERRIEQASRQGQLFGSPANNAMNGDQKERGQKSLFN